MREKQPASRFCFVCGRENSASLKMDFYRVSPSEVEAGYAVPEEYQGYPGIVHGGVIAAMLDEVIGRVFMQGDHPRFMVTAKLEIHYRKPVPLEQPLKIIGHRGKDNGRVAYASGEILDQQGNVLAEAEGVYVNVPEQVSSGADLQKLEWKVYPDGEAS